MNKEIQERMMYMMFRKDGSMLLGTQEYFKSCCIRKFAEGSRHTWKQWYSMGVRCKKVKVSYEEI